MRASGSEGNDAAPFGDVAAAAGLVAERDDGAVFLQAEHMVIAALDGDDAAPRGDTALTVCVVADADNRAVCLQTDRERAAAADGDDVRPVGDIALTVAVFTGGSDRAVCPQGNGVVPACRDRFTGILAFELASRGVLCAGGCVLIIAECRKSGDRAVIVLGSQHLFRCGIVRGRDDDLHNDQRDGEHCHRNADHKAGLFAFVVCHFRKAPFLFL